MAQIILPWAVFAAACGSAMLFLTILPEIFARLQVGIVKPIPHRFWWLGTAAILGLLVWPFFAALQMDWPRSPTFTSVVMMAAAAIASGYVLQYVVQKVSVAYISALTEAGDTPKLFRFGKALDLTIFVSLIGLTLASYWLALPDIQEYICGGRC